VKSPQQGAANWAASSGRAAQAWQEGVQGYNGDWAAATTRQQNVMQANLNNSINSGAWANGVNKVGTQGWKQATADKVTNFSTGFNAGAQKQAASMAKILSAEATIVGNLPPRGDYNANKARATAVMDGLHALKGQLGA
jgi:hypothetical protein